MSKKKKELSTNAIILIVSGLIILAILVVGFTFGWDVFPFSEPQFTIMEEVCGNETLVIFEGKSYTPGELDYEISVYKKSYILDRYYDLGCDILSRHNVLNVSKPCELLDKEYDEVENIFWENHDLMVGLEINEAILNITTEQICEDIEVDGIWIVKNLTNRGEWNKSEQYEDYSYKEFCDDKKGVYGDLGEILRCDITIQENNYLSKKDLSIEWLDENCLVKCVISELKGEICKEDMINEVILCQDCSISKYSCFNKYIVEVTK